MEFDLGFPRAYSQEPLPEVGFRTELEDFQVDEVLGFEPDGEGEHVFLHVRKRGDNTAWVAKQIARLAGVQNLDVGYCGLKDRRAVTTQWFSVYLPKGEEPNWRLLESDSLELLAVSRHRSKLRRGQHLNNRFLIRLRQPSFAIDESLLERIRAEGVPNYFGEQRFGHGGENLNLAQQLLVEGRKIRNRQRRGLVMSAARSYLFNCVLAERVVAGNWRERLAGDTAAEGPQGPLWGRGRALADEQTLELEARVLAPFAPWCDALEHMGLTQERRDLVLLPQNFSWQQLDGDLLLDFALAPGCYATAVLRELAQLCAPSTDKGDA